MNLPGHHHPMAVLAANLRFTVHVNTSLLHRFENVDVRLGREETEVAKHTYLDPP